MFSTWHSGGTSSNGAGAGEGYTTDAALPGLDRGNSIFDVRQRLVANYVLELPWYKSQQGFIGHALGGWQYNGIISWQSGAHWEPWSSAQRVLTDFTDPASPVPGCTAATVAAGNCRNTGGDYNLDGQKNDRPNALANNFNPSHDQWANGWGGQFAPGGGFFTAPCLGCVGDLGRKPSLDQPTLLGKLLCSRRSRLRRESVWSFVRRRSTFSTTPTSNCRGQAVELTTISTTTVLERLAELSTRVRCSLA